MASSAPTPISSSATMNSSAIGSWRRAGALSR
jgi:hypothetical protein